MSLKRYVRLGLNRLGYDISHYSPPDPRRREIPDGDLYLPHFHPWHQGEKLHSSYARFKEKSLLSEDRVWILHTLARQALHLPGEFWECGVYRGGSAAMFADLLKSESRGAPPTLRLFDTFAGMPPTDADKDLHVEHDFNDTSLEAVRNLVGPNDSVRYHAGFIPDTFAGLESSRIAFAHVDVDIYQSILDCCAFIFPRLVVGGFMVFDDYGFATCPGARKAIDEFFADTKVVPLVLSTAQAIVFKGLPS